MAKEPLNERTAIQLVAGLMFGVTIWGLSKSITGRDEPWDSPTPYYLTSLISAGAVSAVLRPRTAFAGLLGIYFGQVLYLALMTEGGGIVPAWIAVLVFGTRPAAVGTVVGYQCGMVLIERSSDRRAKRHPLDEQ